jgi:hypothetical protein
MQTNAQRGFEDLLMWHQINTARAFALEEPPHKLEELDMLPFFGDNEVNGQTCPGDRSSVIGKSGDAGQSITII